MNATLMETLPQPEQVTLPCPVPPRTSPQMIEDLTRLFKLLADRHRLKIVLELARNGPMHVSAIVAMLPGQTQPAVSHHLALMRRAGLLACDRDGKRNYYSLASGYLCRLFEQFFREQGGSELSLGDFCLSFARRPV